VLNERAHAVAERLDREAKDLEDAMQIPMDEARLLHQIVVAARCRSVLEIGVSYGFSTVHLAHAVSLTAGHVHAVEASEKKFAAARSNLAEAGLADLVTLHLGRAQEILPALPDDTSIQPVDCLFIDAVKDESFAYLDAAWPLLAPRASIITDNATTHAAELSEFIAHLREHEEIIASTTIPIGNGIEFSVRRRH